ncbi:hypothetical protein WIW50_19915 [Flavobacteriaceae bacterium 3-367]|uniref:hypothetical protein n=1 Tax=Eudoraea algarum TaxID=3417568 RepID=UPI003290908E
MIHNKFWQAFFALAPIILVFLFLIGYFLFIFTIFSRLPEVENQDGAPPAQFFECVGFLIAGVLLLVLISLSSFVFYIIHAVQNPNLRENNLLLVWVLLFVFVGGIGQLLYWVIEIMSKRKDTIAPI